MEALHVDWRNGVPAMGAGRVSAEQARHMDLQPQAITAFLVGLKSRWRPSPCNARSTTIPANR